MVKEKLCEREVEVRRLSNRVMTVVVLEEDVQRLICGHAPQNRRNFYERQSFYGD